MDEGISKTCCCYFHLLVLDWLYIGGCKFRERMLVHGSSIIVGWAVYCCLLLSVPPGVAALSNNNNMKPLITYRPGQSQDVWSIGLSRLRNFQQDPFRIQPSNLLVAALLPDTATNTKDKNILVGGSSPSGGSQFHSITRRIKSKVRSRVLGNSCTIL